MMPFAAIGLTFSGSFTWEVNSVRVKGQGRGEMDIAYNKECLTQTFDYKNSDIYFL